MKSSLCLLFTMTALMSSAYAQDGLKERLNDLSAYSNKSSLLKENDQISWNKSLPILLKAPNLLRTLQNKNHEMREMETIKISGKTIKCRASGPHIGDSKEFYRVTTLSVQTHRPGSMTFDVLDNEQVSPKQLICHYGAEKNGHILPDARGPALTVDDMKAYILENNKILIAKQEKTEDVLMEYYKRKQARISKELEQENDPKMKLKETLEKFNAYKASNLGFSKFNAETVIFEGQPELRAALRHYRYPKTLKDFETGKLWPSLLTDLEDGKNSCRPKDPARYDEDSDSNESQETPAAQDENDEGAVF